MAMVVMCFSCASKEGYRMADKPMMPIEVARAVLASTQRSRLVDRAFGDEEVDWCRDGTVVASGYFSTKVATVSFSETSEYAPTLFRDADARQLWQLCVRSSVEYNDEGGA